MYVDPAVVRRKVDREVAEFVELIDHYRAQGIWLLEYKFPELLVAFVTPDAKPCAIVPFGVLMDVSNYDVEPPSIRIVNPFTKAPLKASELVTHMPRQMPAGPVNLLQFWTAEDDRPFVCMRGVREYHENPGHSGDHWLLHRGSGAGRIVRLLEMLARYGSQPLGLGLQVTVSVHVKQPLPI